MWQSWVCAGCSGKPRHLSHSPTCAAPAAGTHCSPRRSPAHRNPCLPPSRVRASIAGVHHPPAPQWGAESSEQMETNTPGAGLSWLPLNPAASSCAAEMSSTALKQSQALNRVLFPPFTQPIRFAPLGTGLAELWVGLQEAEPPALPQPPLPRAPPNLRLSCKFPVLGERFQI